jgi:hypothetical protein
MFQGPVLKFEKSSIDSSKTKPFSGPDDSFSFSKMRGVCSSIVQELKKINKIPAIQIMD